MAKDHARDMKNGARKIVARMALGSALCVVLFTGAGTASAHHGRDVTADSAKLLTLSGTVTKVVWANPHIFIYYNVQEENGEVRNYGMEWTNPRILNSLGLGPELFKPGTTIKIKFIVSQFSPHRGEINTVWDSDGNVMWNAEHPYTPYKPGN